MSGVLLEVEAEGIGGPAGFVGLFRGGQARTPPIGVRGSESPLITSKGRGAIKGSIAGPSKSR